MSQRHIKHRQSKDTSEEGSSGSGSEETDEGTSDASNQDSIANTTCRQGSGSTGDTHSSMLQEGNKSNGSGSSEVTSGPLKARVAKWFNGHGWHAGEVQSRHGNKVTVKFDDGYTHGYSIDEIPNMQADHGRHREECFQVEHNNERE